MFKNTYLINITVVSSKETKQFCRWLFRKAFLKNGDLSVILMFAGGSHSLCCVESNRIESVKNVVINSKRKTRLFILDNE